MANKPLLIVGLVVGGLLALGPLLGLLGTVAGLVSIFQETEGEVVQTEAVARDVDLALYSTLAGLVAFPIGVALLLLCGIGLARARPAGRNQVTAPQP